MLEIERTTTSQILITIAAFVVLVAGMSAAKVILVPFLLSVFIAIICAPPLFWLQRKGLPKWLALLIIVSGVLFIGLVIGSLVGTSVDDFSRNLPFYESRLQQQTASFIAWLDKTGLDTSSLALTEVFNPGTAVKFTAALFNGLGSALTNTFLILITVIFILLEAAGMPAKLARIFGGSEATLERFNEFVVNIKHYMAIKTLSSLLTGLLVFLLLTIVGVDYPLLWGLLAFAMNYVPNIGSILAAVPVVILTLIQLDPLHALLVTAGYLVINILIGTVLEPRFMGRELGLSTLVVFLSLLFWGWVLGPVGMLLSVPLTNTAKIALDSRDDTRWIAVLLGPDVVVEAKEQDGEEDDTGE
jgi:AI-2 transport protein TqsA